MPAIITLTTDFGLGSPYVAAVKGVILSINPDVRLVDLSHGIAAQDVRHGAMVLANAAPWFPAGTIHLAVVDPGVGTLRQIVYVEIGDQRYVCPDNGLLSRLTLKATPNRIIAIENREHWLPNVSATFHGRDIMAPVAARLSLGLDPNQLGPRQVELVPLAWPEAKIGPQEIVGSVIWIDDFGNLITNIMADMLTRHGDPQPSTIEILGHTIRGIARTYGDHPPKTLIALFGSAGHLEVALVAGSAAAHLAAEGGAAVAVNLRPWPLTPGP
jgi:hypothetical protein